MTISTRTTRFGLGALAAILALLLLFAPLAFAAGSKPRHRPTYWGAWIGDQLTGSEPPWDMSGVSALEGLTHKGLSLVEFSSPFSNCSESPCHSLPFPTQQMEAIRAYGAIPVFSWGSQSTPAPLDLVDPEFQLARIAAGADDPYIRDFAAAAARWNQPFFLRFDWEMNGSWLPWSEGVNENPPGSYVAAWRHVHNVFAELGATNATWVWCPYAGGKDSLSSMKRFYPGNAYVDWTCLDGYNWAKNKVNPQRWRSFDAIFSDSYRKLTRRIAPRKPVMLGELASGGASHAKAAWIEHMFEQLPAKYRRVRALVWFDQVDRGLQWPLETAPAVMRTFARGLHRGRFKGNSYSALAGSPIRPPR